MMLIKHQTTAVLLAVTAMLGAGLTAVFWPLLWQGGGFVGGDIYPYFFPQKQYLQEAFLQGQIPLWNNRTGFGYPLVGESQTGVFYPLHVLYALLELNAAYHILQLLHCVIAFVGCWMLARRCGCHVVPGWLGATVYTFGWLPVRICTEWSSLGAAWLPWILWTGESFLTTNKRRYLTGLSGLLALQMLAGHFHLAFVTQLALVTYVGLRLTLFTEGVQPELVRQPRRSLVLGLCYLAVGFGLAAVQLVPTWELKQFSQRAALGQEHDPGFGYIPWWYLPQLILPWHYYSVKFQFAESFPVHSRTNIVEAHLYCGLVPVLTVLLGCLFRKWNTGARRDLIWMILGISALFYSTGLLMPVARYLPGFGFFNGVGRYGILVNLSVGILVARILSHWVEHRPGWKRNGLVWLFLVATVVDLVIVSGLNPVAISVPKPPITYLSQSPFRRALAEVDHPVRLFCRGANLPNLLGVSSTPVYLGIGPGVYFSSEFAMPQPLPFDALPTERQIDWLQRGGITHLLSFHPLDTSVWPATLVLAAPDPFLNRAWGRASAEPFFLYELQGSRGRVAWLDGQNPGQLQVTAENANSLTIQTDSQVAGTVIVTELRWPGWTVSVDGQVQSPVILPGSDGQFRAVQVAAGEHRIVWKYQPESVRLGLGISLLSCFGLMIAAWKSRSRASSLTRSAIS